MQQEGFVSCIRTLKSAWGKVPPKRFVSLTWSLIKLIPAGVKVWALTRILSGMKWVGEEVWPDQWEGKK